LNDVVVPNSIAQFQYKIKIKIDQITSSYHNIILHFSMRDGLWVGIIEKSNIAKFLKHFFKNIWIVGWDQLITIFQFFKN
jgi:hypothetical protein